MYLVNVSVDDVVVSDGRDVSGGSPVLLPHHKQDVGLDKEQLILCPHHATELVLTGTLHSEHLVVTLSAIMMTVYLCGLTYQVHESDFVFYTCGGD